MFLWKKPLFSLQPHIGIRVELSSERIFHHQCNMSCCGDKVRVVTSNIARICHAVKVKKYVPVSIWRWLPHLNSVTLTVLAYYTFFVHLVSVQQYIQHYNSYRTHPRSHSNHMYQVQERIKCLSLSWWRSLPPPKNNSSCNLPQCEWSHFVDPM